MDNISAHWRNEKNEWLPLSTDFIYQDTALVCSMFEHYNYPVVLEIDGGYICTKNIFPDVKSRHQKVMSFSAIKHSNQPFYKFLELKHNITY